MSPNTASTPKPAALTPDLCVIGAGAAGLALATAAAAFGVSVVIVERERMGGPAGGSAVLALAAAGARAQAVREAHRLGIAASEPEVNYARVHDHIQRVLSAAAPNVSAERMTALGATVLRGEARFVSRSTVAVGDQAVKARRFVIATGAESVAPAIPGLEEISCLTDESLLTLTRRPDRLVVLGGGATGVAVSQAMRRLGSEVTLVESASLLGRDDPEAVALLRRALLRDGVVLHEGAQVLRAQSVRGGVRLVLAGGEDSSEQIVEGTHLLVATGRRPAIERLDLELAGIASDADGIRVDRGLRSTNRRVYAIGDCAGGAAGRHGGGQVAEEHARLVLRNALFRQPGRFDAGLVPGVTQTQPELASVGLSEDEARAKAGAIRVLRWPYAESARAQAERETEGFVKLVTDARGRLLGVTIVGARAGELIATWALALKTGMSAADMAELVMPYPALSEISKRAATSFLAPLAARPGLRRLIGFLRRFG
ncbi:FAD-dependent oxidoreductase [Bosea sp. 124]|uniref:dihydrolipoyl dehydrogenase family protein n=1 Tax=Bosea sp. 124 TaxID=2135642 RepID=UPI000D428E42|nr:FAD-dependent oxidoreductase [Bosea sp. 124]PTM39255.1 pyruvate/2-oxoglutarate dehydrogenase complex dihydrolipoamide dehydrogenase (E3) component [Bosea sp. 124]